MDYYIHYYGHKKALKKNSKIKRKPVHLYLIASFQKVLTLNFLRKTRVAPLIKALPTPRIPAFE